jgi:hypothetical protein
VSVLVVRPWLAGLIVAVLVLGVAELTGAFLANGAGWIRYLVVPGVGALIGGIGGAIGRSIRIKRRVDG